MAGFKPDEPGRGMGVRKLLVESQRHDGILASMTDQARLSGVGISGINVGIFHQLVADAFRTLGAIVKDRNFALLPPERELFRSERFGPALVEVESRRQQNHPL